MPLTYILPKYHVLILKPQDEVDKERLLRFDADDEVFLAECLQTDETLQVFKHRSETWIILFSRLVEMHQNRSQARSNFNEILTKTSLQQLNNLTL